MPALLSIVQTKLLAPEQDLGFRPAPEGLGRSFLDIHDANQLLPVLAPGSGFLNSKRFQFACWNPRSERPARRFKPRHGADLLVFPKWMSTERGRGLGRLRDAERAAFDKSKAGLPGLTLGLGALGLSGLLVPSEPYR
jgi:hypothetical protein